MNKEEINKIIAEFMGWEYRWNHLPTYGYHDKTGCLKGKSLFTSSSDAIIQVVEKLSVKGPHFSMEYCFEPEEGSDFWSVCIERGVHDDLFFEDRSLSMALSAACVNVIQRL